MKDLTLYIRRIGVFTILLLFFLLSKSAVAESDTALSMKYLREAAKIEPVKFDSALVLVNNAYAIALKSDNDTMIMKILATIGKIYQNNGNTKLALDYLFKSLKMVEDPAYSITKTSKAQKLLFLYNSISMSYFDLNITSLANKYTQLAFSHLEKVGKEMPGLFDRRVHMIFYYNAGSMLVEAEEYDKAQGYLDKALEMNKEIKDALVQASILNNLGLIRQSQGKNEDAYRYFKQSLELREKNNDLRGIASSSNNLAEYYFNNKNHTEAIRFYDKALESAREANATHSQKIALEGLMNTYAADGNFRKAFMTQQKLDSLNTTVFNSETSNNVTGLAQQYEFDKQFRIAELEHQKDIQVQKNRQILFLMLAGLFLLLCIIIFLLFVNQRSKTINEKLQRERLDLESQNLKLEKDKLQLDLDFKNRELTTNVMYLLQKNEFLGNVVKRFQEVKDELPETVRRKLRFIMNEIQQSADDTGWKEFEVRFMDVHQEFYQRLNEMFPDLTPNEKKLAAFLRLNMTTKDISAITYQSTDSIKIARSRLRHKLGLTQDDNLIAFLESL
jgi:tetratricopeptide (TPR) repeat protein